MPSTKPLTPNLQPRPPVVVVLGHVDHGKSSILEAIKDLKITAKESGGITQHIGAYEVEHPSTNSGQARKITFIDTPGHEAFSAMRSRGAKVADIAVLVVAAEEGVKPQTKEAINHIQKAGIPMIVAINKIDKPEAQPEKVKRELAQVNVLVESMGGKIPQVLTSATTKKGINELLELILLVGEMEELKGDTQKPAHGVVIESYLDSQRGPTATLLVRDGVLRAGDIVGTGSTFGKVKILESFQGQTQEMVLPSMPVIMIGFGKVPQVGEKFEVYPDIESAQNYIAKKEQKSEAGNVLFFEEGKKILNLILKTDVQGSIEAIEEVLRNIPQEKIILRFLRAEVGDINENDVQLAKSGLAKILGFRVKINPAAVGLAEREAVKILSFDIIYEIVQKMRQMMEKAMELEKIRVDLGQMKVLAVFATEKNRQVVGGKVFEGEVKKGGLAEIIRGEELVGKGKIVNLQKNKKDVVKALKGEECGVLFEGDAKIEAGDTLKFYETQLARQSID